MRETIKDGKATSALNSAYHDSKHRDEREDHVLAHWSERWGVSDDAIRQAIRKVGPMVKDVARELGRA